MSDELSPTVSPLGEADPNSVNVLIAERITDIFNKPPLLVNDMDLELMIEYYQRERVRFKAESEIKEQRPRTKGRKVPDSVGEALAQATVDLL